MMKFELYEKRRYRRLALDEKDAVYCVVSTASASSKDVTVPATEFSQKGFKLSVTPTIDADFTEDQNLCLKAIVGSRNLTFSDPIPFEVKWQNINVKQKRTYFGCKITDITSESEEQFVSFVSQELKFAGQWGQRYEAGSGTGSLSADENPFECLFNNNHTVMLLIDPESAKIVNANPAAVNFYGWSHERLTRKKITEINTLSKDQVFKEMERANQERRQHFIFQHRLANGDTRHVEVFSGPVRVGGKQFLYSIVHDISERKQAEVEREKLVEDLRKAVAEIKTLKGILPMCSFCNKIRDAKGYWQKVDDYIGEHYKADISHSVCPECANQYYPDIGKKSD